MSYGLKDAHRRARSILHAACPLRPQSRQISRLSGKLRLDDAGALPQGYHLTGASTRAPPRRPLRYEQVLGLPPRHASDLGRRTRPRGGGAASGGHAARGKGDRRDPVADCRSADISSRGLSQKVAYRRKAELWGRRCVSAAPKFERTMSLSGCSGAARQGSPWSRERPLRAKSSHYGRT